MALADSSNNNPVERMIRVEDGLAYQMERSRAAFTAPNRRIALISSNSGPIKSVNDPIVWINVSSPRG